MKPTIEEVRGEIEEVFGRYRPLSKTAYAVIKAALDLAEAVGRPYLDEHALEAYKHFAATIRQASDVEGEE